jgi:hypothetical protein
MTTPSAPRDAGFDPAGLERLAGAIDADIAAEPNTIWAYAEVMRG